MSQKVSRERKISVIISGMPSVGKTTAADAIATRYHLKHVAGGDMLKEMAFDRGYRPSGSDWWDTSEGMKFLSERKTDAEFDKEVDRRLSQYIRNGNVVITSYSMPWLAKDDGLKLWFHATQKKRAERLAGRDKISISRALEIVRRRDRENRMLYKKIYGIEFGKDLSPFNFVIDTNELTAVEVAKAACQIVEEYSNAEDDVCKDSTFESN